MATEEKIFLSTFCSLHQVRQEFVLELHENGLIEIIQHQNDIYIPTTELPKTEKLIRMYSELNINVEGLAVVAQLLERMEALQGEILALKNKLDFYESP